MSEIRYVDRKSKEIKSEAIYGEFFIKLLYGDGWFSNLLSRSILPLICRFSVFSKYYGWLQNGSTSRKKIIPFIEKYQVDDSEFLEPVGSFRSFNDFFIRKLNPSARPIQSGNDIAILPADGRYLVYANIERCPGIVVKDKRFSLEQLLQDAKLAHKYSQGGLVIARLCPVDYHRFHFPVGCVPQVPTSIDGPLFSVNPIALSRDVNILAENKRVITHLKTQNFGPVLFIEVGATYVGSIHQTYTPERHYAKGDEKGYFSFGGSCLLIFFESFRIEFDQDLLENTQKGLETYGQLGQPLGRALAPL